MGKPKFPSTIIIDFVPLFFSILFRSYRFFGNNFVLVYRCDISFPTALFVLPSNLFNAYLKKYFGIVIFNICDIYSSDTQSSLVIINNNISVFVVFLYPIISFSVFLFSGSATFYEIMLSPKKDQMPWILKFQLDGVEL